MLTCNRSLVLECLNPKPDSPGEKHYTALFAMYNAMLLSDNYVLKRQSLKLLSDFLLDRENFPVMIRYIVDRENLKIVMGLLRCNQPTVQFEAFHVFKVRGRAAP